ncbi:MAG: hypothetical protein Q4D57_00135 [Clostridia bacterium]|nr:hypothetical protein [Clostridia bacterium]
MKKIKSFLLSVLLSGVCLIAAPTPAFAGNKQSSERVNVTADIVEKLDKIDRSMFFCSVRFILSELESVFKLLKANEQKLNYNDKRLIFNWCKYILNRLTMPSLDNKERELRDILFGKLMHIESSPTPRLFPVKYEGEDITEIDWNSKDEEAKFKI